MSHGRHVVNKRLKPESDFGTEALCYARIKAYCNAPYKVPIKRYFITAFFVVRFLRGFKIIKAPFGVLRKGVFLCVES